MHIILNIIATRAHNSIKYLINYKLRNWVFC